MEKALENHVDCSFDANSILPPKILEIQERHDTWKRFLQEKELEDENPQKDKGGKGQKKLKLKSCNAFIYLFFI